MIILGLGSQERKSSLRQEEGLIWSYGSQRTVHCGREGTVEFLASGTCGQHSSDIRGPGNREISAQHTPACTTEDKSPRSEANYPSLHSVLVEDLYSPWILNLSTASPFLFSYSDSVLTEKQSSSAKWPSLSEHVWTGCAITQYWSERWIFPKSE